MVGKSGIVTQWLPQDLSNRIVLLTVLGALSLTLTLLAGACPQRQQTHFPEQAIALPSFSCGIEAAPRCLLSPHMLLPAYLVPSLHYHQAYALGPALPCYYYCTNGLTVSHLFCLTLHIVYRVCLHCVSGSLKQDVLKGPKGVGAGDHQGSVPMMSKQSQSANPLSPSP